MWALISFYILRHALYYIGDFAKFTEYFLITDNGITVELHSSGSRLSGSALPFG
jgi:hypothetical protein